MTGDAEERAAIAAAGAALARLEEDCSGAWPGCPRDGLLCDCRLRAVHAARAVREALRG